MKPFCLLNPPHRHRTILPLTACKALLFALAVPASATPVVKEVIAPDLFTNYFGFDNIQVTVRYGPQNEGDDLISAESIRPENVNLTITTAQNPESQGLALDPIYADTASDDGQSLIARYTFGLPNFAILGPLHAGTYTLELLPNEVYSQDISPNPIKTYVPGQVLATFDVGLSDPPNITVGGRLWFEKDGDNNFGDNDIPIEDWGIHVEQKLPDSEDWYDTTLFDETNSLGDYTVSDITPGEYRIGPGDLLPEIGTQAFEDSSRGGATDGWLHFTVTPEMDGESLVMNFPYIEEDALPNAIHDEFQVLFGSSEIRLDVLANDEGTGLRVTHLSDYQTTLDFGGRETWAGQGSIIRTDGRFVYYTPGPGAFGWEPFWYRVTDNSGKTDIARSWAYITLNLPFSLSAGVV